MEGITVLATNIITATHPILSSIFFIIVILLGISFLIIVTGSLLEHDTTMTIGAFGLIISLLILVLCFPIAAATQVPDYNTYEVILDDSVSMNEFMEKYEVLEQRDKIYVIKEKEIEN